MQKLFKQFSFPGGIPSHAHPKLLVRSTKVVSSATPSRTRSARFDNPDLIVAAVVGDGEAETGPLATGWHGNKFLNPVRDGAVLPILHLNGYKIANPCFSHAFRATNYRNSSKAMATSPISLRAASRRRCTNSWRPTLDTVAIEIQRIWKQCPERAASKTGPHGR